MTDNRRQDSSSTQQRDPSRRNFIKGGGMMLAGGAIVGCDLSVAQSAHAFGSDKIRIGLVGCGNRGTAAALQALSTQGGGVELTAMADVFANNLQSSFRAINGQRGDQVKLEDRRFVGLDAYQQLLQCDLDLVLLATPPGFRPQHFQAAVEAGKHVFMEKPLATDAPGVRRIIAAGKLAKEKGLAVQVGLQRRHDPRYRQCIDKLKQGAIGDFVFARAYWNGSGAWVRPRTKSQSELEYQLRNWYYFNWIGGDHIDEQHIHNLDVINWLVDDHPIEAQGQGGRQIRDGAEHGQIFDHHMVEYTYASGLKLLAQCRHIKGCWNNVSEHVHGTAGSSVISDALIRGVDGKSIWQSEIPPTKGFGWQQEHDDLFAALRGGKIPNEVNYAAASTMTAIMGRMATYSGKIVKWRDAINSNVQLADTDAIRSLEDPAPIRPDRDGRYEIPAPGSKQRVV